MDTNRGSDLIPWSQIICYKNIVLKKTYHTQLIYKLNIVCMSVIAANIILFSGY